MQESLICKRCGRRLKDPESIARGMGTICWKKSQLQNRNLPLFNAKTEVDNAKNNSRVPE